jgi:toxic protein SymE
LQLVYGGIYITMSSKKESSRVLTVYYTYQNGKARPLIQLQGKWLQDLGFQTGDKIEVEGNNGSLLIKAVPDESSAVFGLKA